jgi:hypothetical protein
MWPRRALCREADESCALLGYYAASIDNNLPTFRDNEKSVSNYQYSLHSNPEEHSSKMLQIFPTFMLRYLKKFW